VEGEGLDRAGLAYAVVEPARSASAAGAGEVGGAGGAGMRAASSVDAGPGAAAGTTIALAGVGTDAERLRALAAAVAPAHRVVVPEPPRFLYLGRERVGQRWYVESIDGEIEPATFGDALYALEQLVLGAAERFGGAPLLVGEGVQGGGLALALALLLPERLAGVVAVDARLPEVPGWERPAGGPDGLPVLLVSSDDRGGTATVLREVGARVTEVADTGAAAAWWSAAPAG
jgi:predicted esterase